MFYYNADTILTLMGVGGNMKKLYYTDRLVLRNLSPNEAGIVLKFYERNKAVFEPYELKRTATYYTEEYQRDTLHTEAALFNENLFLRYYVFTKTNQNPIGTISFKKSIHDNKNVMILGYRFDRLFWGNGYAFESISYLIDRIFLENVANKLEAVVHPSNHRSIKLLHKLGFIHPAGAFRPEEISTGTVNHHLFVLNPK